MHFFYLVTIMLVLVANCNGEKDDCPLYDTELTGPDFSRYAPATFWEHCGHTCSEDDNCFYWTWDSTSEKCHLKQEKGENKDATGAISGSKDCF